MPIRCIVETITSARDVNGNCYHFAAFYSPAKGRHDRVVMEVASPSNARSFANAILKDVEAILDFEHTLAKREWQHARKCAGVRLYEGSDESKAALRALLLGD